MPEQPKAIVEDEKTYWLPDLARLLGWGDRAIRSARKNGLPIHYVANRAYVSGKEFRLWLESENDRKLHAMFTEWDRGLDFVVLIPSEKFDCGWTDCGHAESLDRALDIAGEYAGSRIFERTGGEWCEVSVLLRSGRLVIDHDQRVVRIDDSIEISFEQLEDIHTQFASAT